MNVMIFFVLLLTLTTTSAYSVESEARADRNPEGVDQEEISPLLARLSDEQVRDLLIAELTDTARAREQAEGGGASTPYGVIVDWLHLFDSDDKELVETRGEALARSVSRLPEYLGNVFLRFGNTTGYLSAFFNVICIVLIFAAGYLAVLFFRKLTPSFHEQSEGGQIPELGSYMRFGAGLLRMVTGMADLAVFAVIVFLLFYLTPLMELDGSRYLFLAILLTILTIRIGLLISHIVCSPSVAALRLLDITDETARTFHRTMLFVLGYIVVSFSCIAVVSELGMPQEGVTVIVITLGSLLLIFTAAILVANRRRIADYIISAETIDTGGNWLVHQFARLWHVPALLYLLTVWIIFLHHQIMAIQLERQAFLLSLLVFPLFLILDRIGHWVVATTVRILKIYHDPKEGERRELSEKPSAEEQERLLIVKIFRGVRVAIVFALFGWFLLMWGYPLPYVSTVTEVVFRSLVTLALALLAWRFIAGYIEKKLLEEEPHESAEEDQDSEWGSPVSRGRAHTLLPMVRKFIGTVMVIMVILTILSTMGVEIGPLLAGAGVVGLAIGFGAQKLVSDVFSGFFFLIDDAFRVGEYLEAGGVSGAVEGITLRNVLLRHHRGMLQIVPYSELGSITNFMRGGVIVKFNLEFPYDTDIDLVRRIIKKVGKAMLEDEEFSKDFIQPVKSQGVREITNSVMVIRVKFTAQPGTHFVIRREAYRRITEALAAKGIYYAHRKVIVEFPEEIEAADPDRTRLLQAGAAADLADN